jgi:DNA-binding transcriptional ArsR family regulator
VPVFLFADAASGFDTFEDELARFASVDASVFRFEFTRGLHRDLPYDPDLLDDPARRAQLLASHPQAGEQLRVALEEPERFRAEVVSYLSRYWRAAFRREWERVEPQLAETVEEAGRLLAAEGPYAFLARISRKLHADEPAGLFTIDKAVDYDGEVREGELYVALASAFVWPDLMVSMEGPWPHALVYPPPFVAGEARTPLPRAELVRLLRALGDDTRLRALRLIAQRPRSTQELAPLVGISEPALSKHLRLLTETGVLARRREGHYVLYSLVPEGVTRLESSLGAFLGGEG